ncbi:hypothetical protein BJ965_000697 [Streptomyces luteogriseus]|uniref:Uncharacterized protein n=1 Tax=Streptomyces luteogriseus TaxID=68233 RepID=A0A7W7DHT8_9ACTN|nr:hypothetical protein [Streptomyces luteogriseus]
MERLQKIAKIERRLRLDLEREPSVGEEDRTR